MAEPLRGRALAGLRTVPIGFEAGMFCLTLFLVAMVGSAGPPPAAISGAVSLFALRNAAWSSIIEWLIQC